MPKARPKARPKVPKQSYKDILIACLADMETVAKRGLHPNIHVEIERMKGHIRYLEELGHGD